MGVTSEEAHRLADEAWRPLVELWMRKNRFVAAAAEIGVGPPHAKALLSLATDDPPPMRLLAHELHCDASFITSVVDRLEELGYVERHPSPTDRRVKTVVLTREGMKARERLEAALYEPPQELLDLPDADLRALSRIVAKIARDSSLV